VKGTKEEKIEPTEDEVRQETYCKEVHPEPSQTNHVS